MSNNRRYAAREPGGAARHWTPQLARCSAHPYHLSTQTTIERSQLPCERSGERRRVGSSPAKPRKRTRAIEKSDGRGVHALVYTPPTHLLHAPGHAFHTHPSLHGAVLIEAREQIRVGTCSNRRVTMIGAEDSPAACSA